MDTRLVVFGDAYGSNFSHLSRSLGQLQPVCPYHKRKRRRFYSYCI